MQIDPVAFAFGPVEVRWYGIIMALAVIVAVMVAVKEASRQKIDPELIYDLALIGAPIGWICARIYYVIFNWEYYGQNIAEIPKIWHGGLAIHGGIIGGLLVGIWFARRHQINFWKLADLVAPSFILAQAIGRWGNYFNQEAYGYETDVPWAMYIDGAFRHPTFLYESLWNFAVFGFLLWFRRRRGLVAGDVYLTYLALYSVGRFWVEALRTDSLMLGPLRAAQVLSILTLVATLGLMWWRHRKLGGEQGEQA